MATVIKLKRGSTTPTTSDLANGEVAIDTSAKKFYINDNGTIKEIAGSSGDSTSPLAGDVRGYTGDGSTTAFTVTSGADVENVLVFVNGVFQRPTTDYTVSGTTLTFVTAPSSSDAITIKELVEGANALNDTGVVRAYTGDGSTTGFTVTATKTDVQEFLVFVNGVFQRPTTDYTVSAGTLTFGTAPALSDAITIKELAEGTGSSILTIVDDTSTSTTLNAGETLKIAGGSNVTTSISGDTLTISSSASGNLTIADDSSTTTTLDLANDTLKVAGGTGITTSISGDTLTITGSSTANVFSTINLNDSTNIVADSTTDTLNLDSSGLISITGDASTDTITVSTVTSATVPFLKADGSSSDIQLQTSGSLADVITNLYIPFTIADGTAQTSLIVGSS